MTFIFIGPYNSTFNRVERIERSENKTLYRELIVVACFSRVLSKRNRSEEQQEIKQRNVFHFIKYKF